MWWWRRDRRRRKRGGVYHIGAMDAIQ